MVSNLVRFTRTLSLSLLAAGIFSASLPAKAATSAAALPAMPLITEQIDNSNRVTLHGNVNPMARPANDRGAADAGTQAPRLQLLLKRPADREAALKQFITDAHNKNSASYHKWLKPDQIAEKYGPAESDVQTVVAWLQSQGLTVNKVSRARSVIEFAGSTGQLQSAFGTSIHKYSVAGVTHYANSSDPKIPSALAPVVSGVVRMNDFRPKSQAKVLGSATYSPKTHKAKGNWNYPQDGGEIFLVGPADFAVQYDTNPLVKAGTNGAGFTVGIIQDSNIDLTLVNAFRTLFSLPANTPSVIVDGTDPGVNGDSIEAYLDVEWAGAVAPGATIDMYTAADTTLNAGLDLAASRAVDDDVAQILSLSFGACEQQLGSAELAYYNSLWEQAAAQGQTVAVSTGDSGSEGCYNSNASTLTYGLAVNGFASTPFNVAVGGTDFYYSDYASSGTTGLPPSFTNYWSDPNTTSTSPATTILGYIPEQPWNNSAYGFNIAAYSPGNTPASIYPTVPISGGSGGSSSCANQTDDSSGNLLTCINGYTKPDYQSALTPADGVRDLPDVSLFAANGLNYSATPICGAPGDCNTDGQGIVSGNGVTLTALGGTSVAAPSFAGVMALIDQATGSAQGQANYVLYPLFAQFPASFHDVVSGSNNEPCDPQGDSTTTCVTGTIDNYLFSTSSAGGYSAAAGYDLASGLGTLDVNQLATNWNKVTFTGTSTDLALSSPTITHGATETLTATVTGATTGDVSFVTSAALPSNAGFNFQTVNSSGVAALTTNILPGGTYNITAEYAGNSTISPSNSTSQTITVNPEPSNINLAVFQTGLVNGSSSTGYVTNAASYPYGTQISADIQPVGTSVAQASGVAPGSGLATDGIATGTATFTDTSAGTATVALNSAGVAEWSTGTFAVGSHSISAKYSGDASFNASTSSAPVAFTITKGTPQIEIEPLLTGQQTGSNLTVQIVMFYVGPGTAPTGTVLVTVGTQTETGTLTAFTGGGNYSSATVTFPSVVSATAVTAAYSGDSNWSATTGSVSFSSGSGAFTTSTTTLTASPSTVNEAQAITLTATVTGSASAAAPTGTVTFYTNTVGLTQLNLPSGATGTPVTATYTITGNNTFGGSNQFVAVYSGDTLYAPSTSAATTAAVDQSDFTLASQNQVVSIANGASGTATVNLGSINGFANVVNLTCASPTAGITCSVNPTSVTVSTSGAVTAAVTINAAANAAQNNNKPFWFAGGSAAIACVLLFGIPARRRSWRALLGLMLFAVMLATNGCGGGSSTSTPPPTTVATPTFSPAAGTYSSAQTVSIADSTSGAAVYYTTDGSTPTASSTKYSGAITVSSTETINAIGVLSGDTTSAVATSAYTISTATTPPATTGSNITIHNVTIQVVTPSGIGTVVVTGTVAGS